MHKILDVEDPPTMLAEAVTRLRKHGAEAASAGLRGRIPGFGPSVYTKFLYVAGKTAPSPSGPQPLILDRNPGPASTVARPGGRPRDRPRPRRLDHQAAAETGILLMHPQAVFARTSLIIDDGCSVYERVMHAPAAGTRDGVL
ncbi:hypothetical protein ABZ478_19670 [Streptomyces sp. NPDC005706]|uniref:8-oxoguanine DNA glycosylase OGG fold protein n=1 Tax=Streptomyces sp. NPDC005706 TaxID=3157169 RepID=UPI00340A8744